MRGLTKFVPLVFIERLGLIFSNLSKTSWPTNLECCMLQATHSEVGFQVRLTTIMWFGKGEHPWCDHALYYGSYEFPSSTFQWSACEIVPVCLSFTELKILRMGRLLYVLHPSYRTGKYSPTCHSHQNLTKTSFKFRILIFFTFNLFSPKSILIRLISSNRQLFVTTGKSQKLPILVQGAFLASFTRCLSDIYMKLPLVMGGTLEFLAKGGCPALFGKKTFHNVFIPSFIQSPLRKSLISGQIKLGLFPETA